MAYTINPEEELADVLSKSQLRAIKSIIGMDSELSPGRQVRVAAAIEALGKDGKDTGKLRATIARGKDKIEEQAYVEDGVHFYVEPGYSRPKLNESVAVKLLPQDRHPEAWRESRGGDYVTFEIGPR